MPPNVSISLCAFTLVQLQIVLNSRNNLIGATELTGMTFLEVLLPQRNVFYLKIQVTLFYLVCAGI